MQFESSNLYHVYNRGNNKQPIFFNTGNYRYFLEKTERYIIPKCDLLAWCLMPNHFHFLIQANNESVKIVKSSSIPINALTEGFRLLLSSYTQGINKQENRTGNLSQQKTKFKCINDGDENYGYTAFQYIHQNPLKANLVSRLEDWTFSSLPEYAGTSQHIICNKAMAFSLFEMKEKDFLNDCYAELPDELIRRIL
ncbi:MAG: transposase [Chitinophagaceae bacterium]|nr:transposase [Chitinophagaceae bacterium]